MNILALGDTKFTKTSLEELSNQFLNLAQTSLTSIVREMVEKTMNSLLEAEFEEAFAKILATKGEDFKNGSYVRTLMTSYGKISVNLKRDRFNSYQTLILKDYQRRLGELDRLAQELFKQNMSCSQVLNVLSSMNAGVISKSTLANIAKDLSYEAKSFMTRELSDCPIVYLDGMYLPLKRAYEGKTSSYERECVEVAVGVDKDGHKCILGFWIVPNEGSFSWKDALIDMKARGLTNPKIFITDGLQGMPRAIKEVYPESLHQRCLVHMQRNLKQKMRKNDFFEAKEDFKKIYSSNDIDEASKAVDSFIDKWSKTYPSIKSMNEDKPNMIAFMKFPKVLWKTLYTSNPVENFNKILRLELKHKISMNSLDQANISLMSTCKRFNAVCSRRHIRGYCDMTDEERINMGFNEYKESLKSIRDC